MIWSLFLVGALFLGVFGCIGMLLIDRLNNADD